MNKKFIFVFVLFFAPKLKAMFVIENNLRTSNHICWAYGNNSFHREFVPGERLVLRQRPDWIETEIDETGNWARIEKENMNDHVQVSEVMLGSCGMDCDE